MYAKGLTLLYKAQIVGLEPLASLPRNCRTRAAMAAKGETLELLLQNKTQFQRAFVYRFTIIWKNHYIDLHSDFFSTTNVLNQRRINTYLI